MEAIGTAMCILICSRNGAERFRVMVLVGAAWDRGSWLRDIRYACDRRSRLWRTIWAYFYGVLVTSR